MTAATVTLLDEVLAAYGGLDRWRDVAAIRAHRRFGGVTWPMKHVSGILDEADVRVSLGEERTAFTPFQGAGRTAVFTPDLVTIEEGDAVVESLHDPRASFAGHVLDTPWTPLQLAYFAGYAMWTYTTEPYSLTLPGVTVEEDGVWHEHGETWRKLQVGYPPSIASHSAAQTLYVDGDGLLRRRDYTVDVLAGAPGAHYIHDHEEIDGILVPRRRAVHVRGAEDVPQPEPVLVSIQLDDVVIEHR